MLVKTDAPCQREGSCQLMENNGRGVGVEGVSWEPSGWVNPVHCTLLYSDVEKLQWNKCLRRLHVWPDAWVTPIHCTHLMYYCTGVKEQLWAREDW